MDMISQWYSDDFLMITRRSLSQRWPAWPEPARDKMQPSISRTAEAGEGQLGGNAVVRQARTCQGWLVSRGQGSDRGASAERRAEPRPALPLSEARMSISVCLPLRSKGGGRYWRYSTRRDCSLVILVLIFSLSPSVPPRRVTSRCAGSLLCSKASLSTRPSIWPGTGSPRR